MIYNRVSYKWRSELAYAIGLIVTDGYLSKDGRHIDFTSKDYEQIVNFLKCIDIKSKYRLKNSGTVLQKKYYSIQFSDVKFYKFLNSIGIYSRKSKTISCLDIPDVYFADFLRGVFDGDGYSTSYWSNRFKNSFVLYLGFVSASPKYLDWLRKQIYRIYQISGKVNKSGKSIYQLKFAKYSTIELVRHMYYKPDLICLSRKKFKLEQSLCIIQEQNAGVLKLVDRHA